ALDSIPCASPLGSNSSDQSPPTSLNVGQSFPESPAVVRVSSASRRLRAPGLRANALICPSSPRAHDRVLPVAGLILQARVFASRSVPADASTKAVAPALSALAYPAIRA